MFGTSGRQGGHIGSSGQRKCVICTGHRLQVVEGGGGASAWVVLVGQAWEGEEEDEEEANC